MEISSVDVKNLREKTGAGMMDCKKALLETKGDFEAAVDFLRRKGLADVAKKQTRIASEGTIGTYVHNGKIGVMVEVNCETDFVARNEEFQRFVKDVAMHIAASDTRFVRAEEMDAEFVAREKSIYEAQLRDQNKPENMIVKIVEGKIKKLASDICLLDQKFIRNPDITIQQLINELTLKIGEKITVRRFVKYTRGEGLEKRQDNLATEVAKMTGQA